jgi:hypothetical protein
VNALRRTRNKPAITDVVDEKFQRLYDGAPPVDVTPHHVQIHMTASVCNPNSRDKLPQWPDIYSSYKQLFDWSFRNEKLAESVRSTFARFVCLSVRSADSHNS